MKNEDMTFRAVRFAIDQFRFAVTAPAKIVCCEASGLGVFFCHLPSMVNSDTEMTTFLIVCIVALATAGVFLWRKILKLERSDATAGLAELTELYDAIVAKQVESDSAIKELSARRSQDAQEVSNAITELVGDIEKMRRSRATTGGSSAFEVSRSRAEKSAYKGSALSHDSLVALAEGR